MSTKDIFSVVGLDKSNRHRDIPERDKIVKYLKGKWITRNQFDKLNSKQLLKIGEWNQLHDHHTKPKNPNFDASKKRKDPYNKARGNIKRIKNKR